jgi:hypothetical protein
VSCDCLDDVQADVDPFEEKLSSSIRSKLNSSVVTTMNLLVAMCGVMVWEMISQNQAQGTPIAVKPNFNYMVRPARIRFSCWSACPVHVAGFRADEAFVPDMNVTDRTEFGCVD